MSSLAAQLQSIPLPTTSFAGQTVIITGSNTGLGLEAARHFVRLDAARVILAVRSVKKGEDAKASIEASTDRKNIVEVWQVDMSNYDSIKDFVKKCDSLDRLDVVVANAGVLRNTYEECEGTEISITVNVIGTFLLALGLFPVLRRIAKALIARTTEVGGRTLVHSAAGGFESHGQYMSECKVKEPSKFVRSKEGAIAQQRVHEELLEILEKIQPGITSNI
ncbi:hypothetical protein CNMCM8927_008762 [Aspergillus lentulus]|uniref:Uncharacterized protein n=1 Tax=Aspergillus lentulus TaxID=293939 RepID=A0AAN5YXG5_ASPLE|nr:hypothetical protein CNMCM6069_009366 [Aspergillus lentulus]KAF4208813.1 hypothetical protein CNMCM8927_008762 [Aspergillus lentulus]